jgi:phospholipid/cholesterol/gamma-HCH transport system substrate-binding protein
MTDQTTEAAPVRNAEFKAALLLILMVVLVAGAAL